MRNVIRFLVVQFFLMLMAGVVWLVASYTGHASAVLQPLMYLVLFLPVRLACTVLGPWIWGNRLARHVDRATGDQSFSPLRVAYGVAVLLLLAGLCAVPFLLWPV